MVRLRVLEILEEQNHTKYWLFKRMDTTYTAFNKMINNQTKSIRYDNIEALCLLLDCTPNDLFEIIEDE